MDSHWVHGGCHPRRCWERFRRRSGRQPLRPYHTTGKSCSWPLLVLSLGLRAVRGFYRRRAVFIMRSAFTPGNRVQPPLWSFATEMDVRATSAFPRIATKEPTSRDVSNVPLSEEYGLAPGLKMGWGQAVAAGTPSQ